MICRVEDISSRGALSTPSAQTTQTHIVTTPIGKHVTVHGAIDELLGEGVLSTPSSPKTYASMLTILQRKYTTFHYDIDELSTYVEQNQYFQIHGLQSVKLYQYYQ